MKKISVLGPSKPTDWISFEAEHLGRLLAQAGYIVYNGGGDGIMELVSKGATEAGGRVIGITVKEFSAGNRYLSENRPEEINQRCTDLLSNDRVFFSPRGSVGTSIELGLALHYQRFGFLPKKKTVMILEDGDDIIGIISHLYGAAMADQIQVCRSAEEALVLIGE